MPRTDQYQEDKEHLNGHNLDHTIGTFQRRKNVELCKHSHTPQFWKGIMSLGAINHFWKYGKETWNIPTKAHSQKFWLQSVRLIIYRHPYASQCHSAKEGTVTFCAQEKWQSYNKTVRCVWWIRNFVQLQTRVHLCWNCYAHYLHNYHKCKSHNKLDLCLSLGSGGCSSLPLKVLSRNSAVFYWKSANLISSLTVFTKHSDVRVSL